MPDFYLLTFITVGGFFLTLVGLHIRIISRVASLERDLASLNKHMEKMDDDLSSHKNDLLQQKIAREKDNMVLWKEIAEMKTSLAKAITILESTTSYIQDTLKRHETLFEKIDKKLS